jgi:hypothetical protein
MVMKEMCESVRAFDVFLGSSQCVFTNLLQGNLQVRPHIHLPSRNLRGADENVAAVPARTVNADGVLARVRCRRVERDFAALVAVARIGWPRCLVPAILKALGDLSDGDGGEREGQREETGFGEHGCGLRVV